MFCVYISVFYICENTWRSYFWRSRAFLNILPTEQPSFLILLADLSADLGNQPGTETHDSQTGLLKINKNAEVRKNMLQSHPDVYHRLMSQTHEKQPNKTCTPCRSRQYRSLWLWISSDMRTHGAWTLGNFCRSWSLRFWKRKASWGSHHQGLFQIVKHGKRHPSFSRQCRLTMNLEPLIKFFITTLSQPDRFIYAH